MAKVTVPIEINLKTYVDVFYSREDWQADDPGNFQVVNVKINCRHRFWEDVKEHLDDRWEELSNLLYDELGNSEE